MDENYNVNIEQEHNVIEAEQERQAVQERYDLEMSKLRTATNELNAAEKRNNAKDSTEMLRVKECLTTVNNALNANIAESYEDFETQVKELSKSYSNLIAACENYLSERKMARFRIFTKGRNRYKKVEALLKVAKKERVQIKNLGKNKELYDLRVEGALVGNALINAVRDHEALDTSVSLTDNVWEQGRDLSKASYRGKRYIMSARASKKPDIIKNAASAGRLLRFMGVEDFGTNPSLVLMRNNNNAYYGVKESYSKNMKTLREIEAENGKAPSVTYEPEALRQISNIKLLRLLLGMERFDVKTDIAFTYEKKNIRGESVYLIKSAKICNFYNAFSKIMNERALQGMANETKMYPLDKEMCEFISEINKDDIDYIAGDLLSKDQKKAFAGRLKFFKNMIDNHDANVENGHGTQFLYSKSDWESEEIKIRACQRIIKDKRSIFATIFNDNFHISGQNGDKIKEFEDAERIRIAEEERIRLEQQRQQEEENRRKQAENEKKRVEEERKRKYEAFLREEAERRERMLEEKRQREAEEKRRREEENRRREEEENRRREEEEKRRREEEEKRRREEEENRRREEEEKRRREEEERREREEEEKRQREEEERRQREEEKDEEKEEEKDEDEDDEEEEDYKEQERKKWRETVERYKENKKKQNEKEQGERDEKHRILQEEHAKNKKLIEGTTDLSKIMEIIKTENAEHKKKYENADKEKILESYTPDEISKALGEKYGSKYESDLNFLEGRMGEIKQFNKRKFEPRYINLNEKKQKEVAIEEADKFKEFYDVFAKPCYELYFTLMEQYEIGILKGVKKFDYLDFMINRANKVISAVYNAYNVASNDVDLVRNHDDYRIRTKDIEDSFENLSKKKSKYNTYIDDLKYRESDAAKEIKKQCESFPDAQFAEGERSEETAKHAEKLIRDLIELRYAGKSKEEEKKAENEMLADFKKLGLHLNNLTAEEFENIKQINERFAYKIYFNYVSLFRLELGKQEIKMEGKELHFSEVKVDLFNDAINENGLKYSDAFIVRKEKNEEGITINHKDDLIENENKNGIYCEIYPPIAEMCITNMLKQKSTNNHLGLSGTCGASSLSQLINQIYGINITNQGMNVLLLEKFSRFNKHYMPKYDEDGKEILGDSHRLISDDSGGTTAEDMSDLLDIFGIKHTSYYREDNPSADSDEKRDKDTGLDTDILMFGEALKKGGSIQVAIKADVLWSRGNDTGKYDNYSIDGVLTVNHWINLCGACYRDGKLIGFLYKDSGNGNSGFVTAKLLDKAYRGVVGKYSVSTVVDSTFTIAEESGIKDEAEKRQNDMYLSRFKENIEENIDIASRFTELLKTWVGKVNKAEDYFPEHHVERNNIQNEYSQMTKRRSELKKKYPEIHKRVEVTEEYKALLKRKDDVTNVLNDEWAKFRSKYSEFAGDALKNAKDTLNKEMPNLKEWTDSKKIQQFLKGWGDAIQFKKYTQETHNEWYGKFYERKENINKAMKRLLELSEGTKINPEVLKLLPHYEEPYNACSKAIKQLDKQEAELNKKNSKKIGQFKKPAENKEELNVEVKKEDNKEENKEEVKA